MGIFDINGPIYKISKIIYNLLVLNILWFVFSIAIITIGPATIALFYVSGKIIRGESYKLVRDFWKSFKLNFKQGIIIFSVFALAFYLILVNIRSVNMLSLNRFLLPVQYFILFELLAGSIIVYPLLARYHLSILRSFKMAFFIANRHLITTILCLGVLPALYYLIYWKPIFLLFIMGIYVFWINFLLKDKFNLYHNR